ncbi:MAG: deoxyribose-phosphate aldolase [Prevotellaceae bacterium]|nr:deoxyribose-phosphate aldolase [Prevotellaceae bacterium]
MITEEQNKYEQALSLYPTDINDEEVKAQVARIMEEKVPQNNTEAVKRFLLGSVELTSLKATDNDESILKLTEKVNAFDNDYPTLPHVATICVYPCFAGIVSESLEVDGVEVACVSGNFPSSQALLDVKCVETALAINDGATEIDMVMSVGRFLAGDYETVCDEIQQIKEACREHPLKVILETGLLGKSSLIKKASILAMYAGADYIKTSTGKEKPAATPEAAYVMCQAIKEYYKQTGIRIGFKPAGGMNTIEDALVYYTIVKEVLGEEWLTNRMFRLGTSRLCNLLINDLLKAEINYF